MEDVKWPIRKCRLHAEDKKVVEEVGESPVEIRSSETIVTEMVFIREKISK